ncbi:hypothetical protein IC235_13510 [Hymenobacter sp. BT664]|uniref:Uncharacterized protein n=1 Tax=Hymenobacter montanus TaxID=2771359 RepID=A0A927BDN3_9BACT|nr:hypothetical protein [Hymenobacter montanus]MBD2768906.1 hypothetical protein [Hymenobacter montanus]
MKEILLVEIEYKMLNTRNWAKIKLTPDEYFEKIITDEDINLNSERLNVEYDFDSVPKYFHAVEYIGCKLSEIEHTKLLIVGPSKNITLIRSETFWNGGSNRLISTQYLGVEKPSHEILVETVINNIPLTVQQVSFLLEENLPKCPHQLLIQCHEDGSESILSEV